MNITNVRLGFANNSSSSHSIVIGSPLPEFNDQQYYQWQEFLLRSENSKNDYLAHQLHANLCDLPEEQAVAVVASLFPSFVPSEWGGVDHQSVFCLPRTFQKYYSLEKEYRRAISLEFFKDFQKYLLQNKIQIAGGNDNQEPMDHGGTVDPKLERFPKDYGNKLICRKDRDYWILFSPETGTKIRLSFTNDNPYESSFSPELCDIKITNYCPFGCEFCYQSSTIDGQHASLKDISSIIDYLSNREVFEIAFGGGEPTLHPDFAQILKKTNESGICANFTTFTLDWTKNPTINDAVITHAKSFALSLNNDLSKIYELVEWREATLRRNVRFHRLRVSIQTILEVNDIDFYANLIETMRKFRFDDLTILGYKSFGRGTDKAKNPELLTAIIELCRKKYITLAVDTVIVSNYKEALKDVPAILYADQEGKFSMYIDVVKKEMARHSYGSEVIPFTSKTFAKTLEENFPFKESLIKVIS